LKRLAEAIYRRAMHTDIGFTGARRRGLAQTLSVYVRLGNMKVYIQWLPPLIGWSLVAHRFDLTPPAVVALGLLILGCLAGSASGGALDHLQGFRDGIDQRTYGADDVCGGFQSKGDPSIKPLVTGELTCAQARRFGIGIAVIGLLAGTAAVLIAPDAPIWLIPVWALWVFGCSQYGYGLKVSYHGAAELLLGVLIGSTVCLSLLLLGGELGWTGVVEAYLIGTLLSQVTLFSMAYDRAVDAAFGRRTLAVRLTPASYRMALVVWIVTGWGVAAAGLATGALAPWQLLAWLPVCAIQVAQLVYGVVREDPLTARLLGWHAFDVAFVTFIVANCLAG
jgi:1,4-dihydroxy-2-naphthoate octaprenyltransferase